MFIFASEKDKMRKMNKTNIAIFVSGSGTNCENLIRYFAGSEAVNCALVVSNKPDAPALDKAAHLNVATAVVCKSELNDPKLMMTLLREYRIDFIVLAGFLSILSARFTSRYPKRIINIHPSLIPSFCGVGYYGLKVHEKALERGVKVTGATVHFVNEGMDEGPIIAQKAVAVEQDDTAEILQRRVMEQAEWILLPQAIDDIANGRITITDGHVRRVK